MVLFSFNVYFKTTLGKRVGRGIDSRKFYLSEADATVKT